MPAKKGLKTAGRLTILYTIGLMCLGLFCYLYFVSLPNLVVRPTASAIRYYNQSHTNGIDNNVLIAITEATPEYDYIVEPLAQDIRIFWSYFGRLDHAVIATYWGIDNTLKWNRRISSLPNDVSHFYDKFLDVYIKLEEQKEKS